MPSTSSSILANGEDTVSIDRPKPAFIDEPLRDAPTVRDGARSVQTREPEAVRPHPVLTYKKGKFIPRQYVLGKPWRLMMASA